MKKLKNEELRTIVAGKKGATYKCTWCGYKTKNWLLAALHVSFGHTY